MVYKADFYKGNTKRSIVEHVFASEWDAMVWFRDMCHTLGYHGYTYGIMVDQGNNFVDDWYC